MPRARVPVPARPRHQVSWHRQPVPAWLAALRMQRPVIGWPYVVGEHDFQAAIGEIADVRTLALGADVIYHDDGSVAEVVPGSHGPGVLQLDEIPAAENPGRTLAALYQGGVRRLLLSGGSAMAEPFLALGVIDHVFAYLPDGSASRRPSLKEPLAVVPPGFTIVRVKRLEGFVRVEAEQSGF